MRTGSLRQRQVEGPVVRLHPHHAGQVERDVRGADADGVGSILPLDLRQGAVEHHLPFINEQDAVAQRLHQVHLMGAEDNGLALPMQFCHQILDALHVDRIQSLERLVEEQNLRVVDEAGDELKPLLHTPAQVLDLTGGPLLQFDPLQQVHRPFAGRGPRDSLQFGQVDQRIQYFQVAVEPAFLREIPDLSLRLAWGLAQNHHAPFVRPDDVHNDADGGGFPGPVRPQEAEHLPSFHLEGEAVHRHHVPVPLH